MIEPLREKLLYTDESTRSAVYKAFQIPLEYCDRPVVLTHGTNEVVSDTLLPVDKALELLRERVPETRELHGYIEAVLGEYVDVSSGVFDKRYYELLVKSLPKGLDEATLDAFANTVIKRILHPSKLVTFKTLTSPLVERGNEYMIQNINNKNIPVFSAQKNKLFLQAVDTSAYAGIVSKLRETAETEIIFITPPGMEIDEGILRKRFEMHLWR